MPRGKTTVENIAGPYERGLLNGQLMGSTTAESFTIVGGFLKQPIWKNMRLSQKWIRVPQIGLNIEHI